MTSGPVAAYVTLSIGLRMQGTWWRILMAVIAVAPAAGAVVVGGGGPRGSDCVAVVDAAVNSPAPPHTPRYVDCVDGDTSCDTDGLRNARCTFDLRLCVNSTANATCTPVRTDSLVVDYAVDDGNRRFDPEFQALQQRVDLLGFPDVESPDRCALPSVVTVLLRPPRTSGKWTQAQKRVRWTARGFASGRPAVDRDRIRFRCRPEGDALYDPGDLYAGTFDRIAQQLFATTCAVSGCHDSESHQNNLVLLPGAAHSQLVGVTPVNAAAAGDGLERVFAGDPDRSLLYRKITGDLPPGYDAQMPLGRPPVASAMTEIIRLWILDGAPETGWVAGTDQ